jgi:hypothetical protein
MANFILIKMPDFDKVGKRLSAHDAALAVARSGVWPLWSRTPCKDLVKAGDKVAIYTGGAKAQRVIAKAVVEGRHAWSNTDTAAYPLAMSGIPLIALQLKVTELAESIHLPDYLDLLDLTITNKKKWGVKLMGGMRSMTDNDYALLTGQYL